ncbi:MAG: hypothetical protein JJ966_00580 [Balneolaceae bacterium]|nr:hypothetical protein [Balneolaceae bacterium]
MRKKLTSLFVLSILTISYVQAQSTEETERGSGVTAVIQSDQLEFQIPIWTNNQTIIAPVIGAVYAQDIGTDLTVGLVLKKFQKETVGAVPFFSIKGGAVIGMPKEGDTITDFVVGLGYGGEYFFNPNFSIGIELQGNASISDEGSFRFGNPGNVNFNTATLISASIYF